IIPMRGLPQRLNVPKIASADEQYRADLQVITGHCAIALGELPSGLGAGVHAVKQFEKEIESLAWRMEEPPDLYTVQSASAVVSAVASNSMSFMWKDRWQSVEPPGDEFFGDRSAVSRAW